MLIAMMDFLKPSFKCLVTIMIVTIVLSTSYMFLPWKGETIVMLFSNQSYKKSTENGLQDEIKQLYPWLMRQNCLPNYFTRSRHRDIGNRSLLDGTYMYKNCTVVFLHNWKSGGTTVKNCLSHLMPRAGEKRPMLIGQRTADRIFTNLLNGGDDFVKTSYMGAHTFSVCDFTTRPCAYFFVMRDPLERIISLYNMCKQNKGQTICIMRNVNHMTLNDWAIHQGSVFFHQLLQNAEFFTNKYTDLVDKLRSVEDPPTERIPPWWRNKLILDHLMDSNQKSMVLDFVLANLESWFAVIGLTAEFDISFRLFERVFQLPFYKQCAGNHKNSRQYSYQTDKEDVNITKEEIVKDLKKMLSSDPGVMKALHYDIKIYKKAQNIFKKQKTRMAY
ncbi:uncharacterized protein [Ptychodera flava]|uniref:uncharacterized protein n=1 Tax=Ptychodera flava TaxID=63121 RepID=UPI00396A1977